MKEKKDTDKATQGRGEGSERDRMKDTDRQESTMKKRRPEKEDEGHRQTREHNEEKAVKEKEDEGHRQTRQHKEEKAVKEKEDEGHRQDNTRKRRQ